MGGAVSGDGSTWPDGTPVPAQTGVQDFTHSALQGSIGFGAGMVAASAIALVEPALLPALVVMFACLLTLRVTWREKANLDLAGAGWGGRSLAGCRAARSER